MAGSQRGTLGGIEKEEGLDPVNTTLSERARKEQMPKVFGLRATETRQLEWVAERDKALCRIHNPVGHLPVEVDDPPIYR